jgi:hypothetical protein
MTRSETAVTQPAARIENNSAIDAITTYHR